MMSHIRQLMIYNSKQTKGMLRARQDKLSPGALIRRDLQRWYQLLAVELDGVIFGRREGQVVYEALSRLAFDRRTVPAIPELVESHIALTKAMKSQNATPLKAKLHSYTLIQLWAIADAVERVRSETWPWPEQDLAARLRKVGLAR